MIKNVLIFIVTLFSTASYTQQYNFIRYGVKEGLAQSQVTDICQDNLGQLWIGTQSGLSCFDGNDFVNYSIDDGLADNKVDKLLFSEKDNTLWIATPKGITEFKNKKFKSYPFSSNFNINDLILFQDSLFIASNNGLISFKNGHYTHFPTYNKIRQLATNNNNLFCATNKGLHYHKNGAYLIYPDSLLSTINFSGIHCSNNILTLSTYGFGILSYNLEQKELKTIKQKEQKEQKIKGLYIDNNDIWGLGKFGIIHINRENNVTYYNDKNGLTINYTKRIFKDNEGNIWIATYGKGLLKFSSKAILNYTVKDGLSSDIVMGITSDESGTFCFGTYDKGLVIKSGKSFNIIQQKDGLNHNSVWSVFQHNNSYWVGTNHGVNQITDTEIISKDSISGKIRSIIAIDENTLFFGEALVI